MPFAFRGLLYIKKYIWNRLDHNKRKEIYREDYHIENAEYINTPLIFEDYFIQHLAGKNVTVYTFFSTVALSVCSLSNVKVVSIKPKSITDESYLECYEIFQKMGIEVIDYDG